jgi:hypothetical protein
MHWCPVCGGPCYCDFDDTDFGTFIPDGCMEHGFGCDEIDDNEDDDYEDDDTDELFNGDE